MDSNQHSFVVADLDIVLAKKQKILHNIAKSLSLKILEHTFHFLNGSQGFNSKIKL